MAVVAIIGRPNVGKSTLFNRLVGGRQAIVDDTPGVTRDRNYAEVEWGETSFTLVDTGGFEDEGREDISVQIRHQVEAAIVEADAVIFVCDGRTGLTPLDEEMMRRLRRALKPLFVAVNKMEMRDVDRVLADFYALGVERLYPTSAAHGQGVWELADDVVAALPKTPEGPAVAPEEVRVAVIGRPNVGKSSLVNRVLGYERVVVSAEPGTTRDAVDTPVDINSRPYVLVDTAGIRRKGRLSGPLEHYGMLRALKAMERSDVCLLLIDASEGLTDQDKKVAAHAFELGKGIVVAVNKWDLLAAGPPQEASKCLKLAREGLHFLGAVPIVTTSAVEGTGLEEAFAQVQAVYDRLATTIGTGILNRALEAAVAGHEPPAFRGKHVKLYYITQVGTRPPRFAAFVNYPQGIGEPYRRYLITKLRQRLGLESIPVKLLLKARRKEN